jgi:hypothetical protein
MPRRCCSACNTHIDESAVCFDKLEAVAITFAPNKLDWKVCDRPQVRDWVAVHANLTVQADKESAMPSNMDTQRQPTNTGFPKQVPPASAQRSVSRSSSMLVEDGKERDIAKASSKPQSKEICNYSMDRWLNQKPSEEPWYSGR